MGIPQKWQQPKVW